MNDKGLVFFTLAAACFYLIYDDLWGKRRVSSLAAMLTPDLPGLGDWVEKKKETYRDNMEKDRTNEDGETMEGLYEHYMKNWGNQST